MNTLNLKFCPLCNNQAPNQDDNYCECCGSLYKVLPIRRTNDPYTNLRNQKNFMYFLYIGFLISLSIWLGPLVLDSALTFKIEMSIILLMFIIIGSMVIYNLHITSDQTKHLAILFNGLLAIIFVIPFLSFYSSFIPSWNISPFVYVGGLQNIVILIFILPIFFFPGNIFLLNSRN